MLKALGLQDLKLRECEETMNTCLAAFLCHLFLATVAGWKKGWIDLGCDLIALQIARFKSILVKRSAWQITWVLVLCITLESDV